LLGKEYKECCCCYVIKAINMSPEHRVVTIYRLTGGGKTYYGSTEKKLLQRVCIHTKDVTCASYTSGISTAYDFSWNVVATTNQENRYDIEKWFINNNECVNKATPKPPKGHSKYVPPRYEKTEKTKKQNEIAKRRIRTCRKAIYRVKPHLTIKKGIVYHMDGKGGCEENPTADPYFFITTTPFGKATQKNDLYMKHRAYVEERVLNVKDFPIQHTYNCPDCGCRISVPSQSVMRRHFGSKKHLFSVGLITANERKNVFYNKGVFDVGQPHKNLIVAVQEPHN
jgi:hypothetical protein